MRVVVFYHRSMQIRRLPFHSISLGNAHDRQSDIGVSTGRPGTLTNDFLVNLLKTSKSMKREAVSDCVFAARNRAAGEKKWVGTRVDLTFGSNSQSALLRRPTRPTMRRRRSRCLRSGMEKGDEPRSVRPRVILAG